MSTSSPRRFVRFFRFLGLSGGAALLASGAVMGTATAADDTHPEPEHGPGMMVERPLADPCQVGEICIWDEPNGQGNRVDYNVCTENAYDVTEAGLSRVASFVNNQTDGTVAEFYYPDENDEWHVAYQSTAFEFWDNDRGHPYVTQVDPC